MASATKVTNQVTELQLVTFHLGNEEFGANIMNVKEIVRISDITKVPNAPSYIEGVCNLRGRVLPIIDGRSRLNMEKKEHDERSRVLVIDIHGRATGMIVDRVSEVMSVYSSDVEPPPAVLKNIDTDYISGVVKLNGGKRLIMFLEMFKILKTEDVEEMGEFVDGIENGSIVEENKENKLTQKNDEQQLVSFAIDCEEYALDIMQVKEIIRVPDIVKVPNCKNYIDGVVSIRNNLIPIINLRVYFGLQNKEVNDHTRILIVDTGNVLSGILVDKVTEVIRVPMSVIQPPPKVFYDTEGDQIKGIAKLNDGERLILLLDPFKMISIDEILDITGAEENNFENMEGAGRKILDEEQLVTFRLDNEEFAVKIDNVQEINRMTEITKIPRSPHFVEGIVNLRGNIIPALDLRKFFNLSKKERTDATRVIIVDINSKKTGIIVDSVSEVLRFEKKLIEEPPKILSNGVDSEYIEGVGKLNEGKRMILILSLGKVVGYNERNGVEDNEKNIKEEEKTTEKVTNQKDTKEANSTSTVKKTTAKKINTKKTTETRGATKKTNSGK